MSRIRRASLLTLSITLLLALSACTADVTYEDPSWAQTALDGAAAAEQSPTPELTPTSVPEMPTITPAPTATPLPTAGPPPEIIAVYPVDGDLAMSAERPVVLVFDRAMDQASIGEALSISPETSLHYEWAADDRLSVQAEGDWQPGITYTLSLSQGTAATDGATLAEPFELSFSVGGRGAPIPVLMYHHFAELDADATQGQRDWTVSPEAFAEQLAYLQEHDWHTISTAQLADYMSTGEPLPLRPLMITIDDGYREVLEEAYPLFLQTELRPVLFVVTDYADYAAYLNWDELGQLVDAGFMIGSHSIDHSDMTQASAKELEQQVAGSLSLLEEQLGVQVDAFCYPFGSMNQSVMDSVSASGYRTAYSLNPTIYQSPEDPFFIGRMRVDYDTSLDDFIAMLPD